MPSPVGGNSGGKRDKRNINVLCKMPKGTQTRKWFGGSETSPLAKANERAVDPTLNMNAQRPLVAGAHL